MNLDTVLKGHFLNLYHMALTDAEVDTKELEMLYIIGKEKGITKAEIDAVVVQPDSIKFSSPKTLIEKVECLYDFARIAWADGKIDNNEKILMEYFSSRFGFQDENISTIVEFLLDEVEKGTSKDEVFKIVNENI
jgi:uncharacterized tellurite resistance protein B-like protein